MFILKKSRIIGLFFFVTLLLSAAGQTHAFYSPVFNQEAEVIRQHITKSKQIHGVGTWWNALETISKSNSSVNEGYKNLFANSLKEVLSNSLTSSFGEGLGLIFKRWGGSSITNCLRDDIWEAQALQEQVLNELFKSAILSDLSNSTLLWDDYNKLGKNIEDLKANYRNGDVWFPKKQNYYVECPYGDFTQAWDDLKRALDSFKSLGSGNLELGSFGSLAKAAQKQAIARAQRWIKANQLTVTVGGKQGANPRSLFNGPGLAGLAADIKTELGYVKTFADAVYSKEVREKNNTAEQKTLDLWSYVDTYNSAEVLKKKVLNQMETAVKFNLSLNNVSENSLIEIDKVMRETNGVIKDSYDKSTTPQNLKSLCEKIVTVLKKQCKGKSVVPSCQ